MRKRLAIISMRMKPEEKLSWQDRAQSAGMTLADFIRDKMDGAESVHRAPRRRRPSRKADPMLLIRLGRVGSNLNQLAKWANTYKSAADAHYILLALLAIEQALLSFGPPTRSGDAG